MLARTLVGIVGLLVAAAPLVACNGQLNAAYCADHLDDVDCRNAGLVRVDAPRPECVANADCANSPAGLVCDTARNKCVQCIKGTDDGVCTSQTMVCGPDQKCHGCVVDSDCSGTSMVCLPSQMCATEAAVLYAAPTASGSACSKMAPCPLPTAVGQLSAARHIIKMTTTFSGVDYLAEPITIDQPFGVQIIATSTTLTPVGIGDAITASGQNLEILGMTLTGTQGTGVKCTAGILTVRRTSVSGSTAYGLDATACTLTVEASRFASNKAGGVQITSGEAELHNNILDRNGTSGSGGTTDGALHIVNASGRAAFNTIALNLARDGGSDRIGGIKCSASGGGFALRRNILADNGNKNLLISACTSLGNYDTADVTAVKFLNTNDFRLTAQSPPGAVLDDPGATEDCKINGAFIDDYQGDPRPANAFCDVGADELEP
jgi:hypothetical protein